MGTAGCWSAAVVLDLRENPDWDAAAIQALQLWNYFHPEMMPFNFKGCPRWRRWCRRGHRVLDDEQRLATIRAEWRSEEAEAGRYH